MRYYDYAMEPISVKKYITWKGWVGVIGKDF